MNSVKEAQRQLDIACLETVRRDPKELTVSMYVPRPDGGFSVDLVFTKEQVLASCERQLTELKEPRSIGEQIREIAKRVQS